MLGGDATLGREHELCRGSEPVRWDRVSYRHLSGEPTAYGSRYALTPLALRMFT